MRAVIFCGILQLCLSGVVPCGEPSGGAGGAGNPGGGGRAAGARKLPWPEPDAKKVAEIEAELKKDLPDFHIVRVGPWIVATDLAAEEAPRYTESTIGRYAADIQRQLFTSKPRSEPVKVLLFKDRLSYETWNRKLFGEKPGTPYGYYSRQRNALVMNIATGGGTLLHEMAHAMAEADFSTIPAWLNEGIGSLFEASDRDRASGKVIGVANWRLAGLKKDLEAGTATGFKDLLGMSDADFYGPRSGSNYAAARYLMQFLQERGKLEAFYARVRDKKDADAASTLRAVFDNKQTLEQIESACYEWAKGLVPPR